MDQPNIQAVRLVQAQIPMRTGPRYLISLSEGGFRTALLRGIIVCSSFLKLQSLFNMLTMDREEAEEETRRP